MTICSFAVSGQQIRALFLLLLLGLTGCRGTGTGTFTNDRPVRFHSQGDGYVIQSDAPLGDDSPLIKELNQLRREITATLQLPPQRDPVTIYLFENEDSYRRYMRTTWPNLPPRRAYFVGTRRELAIYSYRGQNVQTDLRHEFTHGLLHGSLETVPLWLDEGLAEYFEVRPVTGGPHKDHIQHLQNARADGWGPSLAHLEELTDFRNMTQRDYAESWGWVHYMLNQDGNARSDLIAYLQELRSSRVAPPFQPRLEQSTPNSYNSMISHVSRMANGIALTGFERGR